jgi:hypothetical protein
VVVLLPLGLSISAPAFADDEVTGAAAAPMSVRVIGTTKGDDATSSIVKKKEGMAGTTAETDDTYLNSLKKEAAKQNAMKKTKAQKAVELCERLGRGC